MAGEPRGKGHPTLQIDPRTWPDGCRDNYLEGPLVCPRVAREGAKDDPGGDLDGDRYQIVHYELSLIVLADVPALPK